MIPSSISLYGQTEKIYTVQTFNYIHFLSLLQRNGITTNRKSGGYYNTYMTFDIETTSVNNVEKPYAFMYIWQACINSQVIMGRTWEEFLLFVQNLNNACLQISDKAKFVIYVHFLPFEFQFIRNFFTISDFFALHTRQPVRFTANGTFEFRCSYKLSNMNLEKFIQSTPNAHYYKKSGEDFDYSIFRTPFTSLTEEEYGYCYCDVRGLQEAIDFLLESDNLATIPMTSTGYIRREVKKCMHARQHNIFLVKEKTALSPDQYVLCKYALRGGNAHANPIYAGDILQ